jgi:hypothetical protein
MLQNPSKIIAANLKNVRREVSRRTGKKRGNIRKKNNVFEPDNTKKIRDFFRGINKYKNGSQPRSY